MSVAPSVGFSPLRSFAARGSRCFANSPSARACWCEFEGPVRDRALPVALVLTVRRLAFLATRVRPWRSPCTQLISRWLYVPYLLYFPLLRAIASSSWRKRVNDVTSAPYNTLALIRTAAVRHAGLFVLPYMRSVRDPREQRLAEKATPPPPLTLYCFGARRFS